MENVYCENHPDRMELSQLGVIVSAAVRLHSMFGGYTSTLNPDARMPQAFARPQFCPACLSSRARRLCRFIATVAAGVSLSCSPEPQGAQWVPFTRNLLITGSLDTTRLVPSDSGRVFVWLGFDYRTPVPYPSDSSRRYRRMEFEAEVDCTAGRTKDIHMRLFADTPNAEIDHHLFEASRWTTFDEHPAGGHVFRAMCDKLAEIGEIGSRS